MSDFNGCKNWQTKVIRDEIVESAYHYSLAFNEMKATLAANIASNTEPKRLWEVVRDYFTFQDIEERRERDFTPRKSWETTLTVKEQVEEFESKIQQSWQWQILDTVLKCDVDWQHIIQTLEDNYTQDED